MNDRQYEGWAARLVSDTRALRAAERATGAWTVTAGSNARQLGSADAALITALLAAGPRVHARIGRILGRRVEGDTAAAILTREQQEVPLTERGAGLVVGLLQATPKQRRRAELVLAAAVPARAVGDEGSTASR